MNNNLSSQSNRLILIGGSPRSGTTLLQNMLDCHTEILGGPEFLHLKDIIKLRSQLYTSLKRNWINLICSHEDVDARIREMIEGFLITFADRQGTRLLSEKTPESVLVFSELAEVLPDTRFIHVVRDPRAIAASLIEVADKARNKGLEPPAFASDLRSIIKSIRQCFNKGFQAVEKYPQRMMNVCYENLVTDPEAESRKIFTFLELEWQPGVCSPADKSHLGEQAITEQSNEIWYDKSSYNRNPSTDSLDKWKQILSVSQQISICKEFSSNEKLRELGYDLTVRDVPFVQQITANASYQLSSLRYSVPKVFRQLKRH